jgi:tRNA A37 threonylcarbamoyladenosine synthetase subunit TsaC/SUA5/YrdC
MSVVFGWILIALTFVSMTDLVPEMQITARQGRTFLRMPKTVLFRSIISTSIGKRMKHV